MCTCSFAPLDPVHFIFGRSPSLRKIQNFVFFQEQMKEGVRCYILMTFHPSVTDVIGSLHLMRHFWTILSSKLKESDEAGGEEEMTRSIDLPLPHEDQQQHLPIEQILQSEGVGGSGTIANLRGLMWRGMEGLADYVIGGVKAHPEEVDSQGKPPELVQPKTLVLRGFLKEDETRRYV